ncbi:ATP-binding protein [Haloferula chungangensis]|uniref:ATP-binding protein n=1 Tax=Haloferula chungangensis TaxID=1048331 RepID=A0ABW2L0L9_9BACT
MTPTAIHPETPVLPVLTDEWARMEMLGGCLQDARQGRSVSDERLTELREKQEAILQLRSDARAWANLPVDGLSMLEMDILVCALLPEVQPRLAWMYQSLQPGLNHPHATLALVQAMLALDLADAAMLRGILLPDKPLRKRRLIEVEGSGPFQILKPARGVVARLLNVPDNEAPPGAVLVEQKAHWDDLILSADRKAIIREYLMWIHHEKVVVGEWAGQPVGGPVALFTGRSGTGKTFAALAIANELGWPLYRVDLGKLVSKYIGETEKNLNRLFDAAHGQPIILQFDEVDSIMGKRGDLREARDRYANMEVSHLLARIEQHRGPCILTTNLRDHLDTAFYRRFQAVVEFPQPDADARALLWNKLLPSRAPLGAEIDLDEIASAVSLTGGNIRNAALHAAYLAADDGTEIHLRHLALAVWRELTKSGKAIDTHDLGILASHLPKTTAF